MSDFIPRRFVVETHLQGAPVTIDMWEVMEELDTDPDYPSSIEGIRQLHGKIRGNGPFPLVQGHLIGTPFLSAVISVRNPGGDVRSWGPYHIYEQQEQSTPPQGEPDHDRIEADEPDVWSTDKQRMDELYDDLQARWKEMKDVRWNSDHPVVVHLMLDIIDRKLAMEQNSKSSNPFGE